MHYHIPAAIGAVVRNITRSLLLAARIRQQALPLAAGITGLCWLMPKAWRLGVAGGAR